MKRKHELMLYVFVAVIIFGIWFLYKGFPEISSPEVIKTKIIPHEEGVPIQVYFCPRDNCGEKLANLINSAQEVECAFYNLNIKNVKDALKSKTYKLIVDSDGEKYVSGMNYAARPEGSGLMHNKFCILDNITVFTGSFNPKNQYTIDANNILIINSKYLAENYLAEFSEMENGWFASGDTTPNPKIIYNGEMVENYFCPEDSCAAHLIDVLKSAEFEIKFLTFSFTHDEIGNLLIEKVNAGINVSGVFDKSQAGSQYSEYWRLQNLTEVKIDTMKGLLHHKVFIIDREIVATGSFNPTRNGDTRNDENLLIIHSPAVAERYLEEFDLVFGNSTK